MSVDWTKFDQFSESECTCACGAHFHSHAKIVMEPTPRIITRKPCPDCNGAQNIVRVSSEPETMTLSHPSVRDSKPE